MIFLKPVGGLCNRMRAIDSMISLCEEHGQNLTIIWLKTQDLNCDFKDLFLPIRSRKIKIRLVRSKFIYRLILKLVAGKDVIKNVFFENIYSKNRILNKDLPIGVADKESTFKIIEITRELFSKNPKSLLIESCYRHAPVKENSYSSFQPITEISRMIKSKINEFRDTFGIHIRRTDHVRSIETTTDEKVIKLIRGLLQEDPQYTFFLATDCQLTKNNLLKEFGENIITNFDLSFDRNKKDSIQFAVLDLYCLAETKRIYGSFYSSYSEVAAAINNIENVVIQ